MGSSDVTPRWAAVEADSRASAYRTTIERGLRLSARSPAPRRLGGRLRLDLGVLLRQSRCTPGVGQQPGVGKPLLGHVAETYVDEQGRLRVESLPLVGDLYPYPYLIRGQWRGSGSRSPTDLRTGSWTPSSNVADSRSGSATTESSTRPPRPTVR